jgi:hypothetical protein
VEKSVLDQLRDAGVTQPAGAVPSVEVHADASRPFGLPSGVGEVSELAGPTGEQLAGEGVGKAECDRLDQPWGVAMWDVAAAEPLGSWGFQRMPAGSRRSRWRWVRRWRLLSGLRLHLSARVCGMPAGSRRSRWRWVRRW